jgi:2-polyprenyl-3-methyl-5-hydroxy-6-metoxy-1,4-benzoquinol methylase/Zn ribbon nucleic-acid-binding protein
MANRRVAAAQARRYCPACDRDTRQFPLWRKNGSQIFRCAGCGLGAAAAPHFDPLVYYTADYFSSQEKGGYPDYRASEPVLRAEFRRMVAFVRRIVPAGRLLEIGAAYGFFLSEAAAHYDVRGIEIVDEAAAFARRRGLDVRTGRPTPAALAAIGALDVIVMLDVVEHLEEPGEVLRLMGQFLRPGGAVILTTPDFASPLARLFGRRWRNLTPPHHLWYFTAESLARLAAAAGLEIAEVAHPWKRVPAALVLQLLGRSVGVGWPPSLLSAASRVGLPVNLFDAMRVVLRKPPAASGGDGPDLTRERCR